MIKLSDDKHWDYMGFAPYASDDGINCAPECVYYAWDWQNESICFLAIKGKCEAENLNTDDAGHCIRRQECVDLFGNGE